MEWINMKRGAGKTENLLVRSAGYGATIVAHSDYSVRYIKDLAKEFGLQIPEPISLERFLHSRTYYKNGILLDDVDLYLNQLLPYNVLAVTTSLKYISDPILEYKGECHES